jgi:hypothetical protein
MSNASKRYGVQSYIEPENSPKDVGEAEGTAINRWEFGLATFEKRQLQVFLDALLSMTCCGAKDSSAQGRHQTCDTSVTRTDCFPVIVAS